MSDSSGPKHKNISLRNRIEPFTTVFETDF